MRNLFHKGDKQQQNDFQYSPLGAGEIRLLELEPSTSRLSSNQLSGHLFSVSLRSLSEKFKALSYFWGSDPADHPITLNNSSFLIKPNLEGALLELSKVPTPRLLWVDAICINQGDTAERNEQVRLMKAIYETAESVVVWLGVFHETNMWGGQIKIPIAEIIRGFAQRQRDGKDQQSLSMYLENPFDRMKKLNNNRGIRQYPEMIHFDHSGGYWPHLVRFLDRKWWQRVWVRQEVAMSQKAIVYCGDQIVPWPEVAALCHWLKVYAADLDLRTRKYGGSNRSGAYSGEDLEYFRQTMKAKGGLDFESMMIHARNCEATDPRDKVFAILGLTGDPQEHITIDYSQPVSDVAIQAFKKLVAKENKLEALVFSQNSKREQGTPSWAPNLCSSFNAQPSRLGSQTKSLFAATKDASAIFSFSNKMTLNVAGIIFDKIRHLSTMATEFEKITPGHLDSGILEWRPLFFDWLRTMDIDQRYERLMRILTYDRDIRGTRLDSRGNGIDWGTFFRVEHVGVGARTELEFLSRAVRRSMFEGAASGQTEVDAWLRLCGESIGSRRMTMTTDGRVGLVPGEARSGDVICLILGLDVPFVLRELDAECYVLVGEAYIFGVMDGEILAAGVHPTQDIKLQ